jgi:hypothetical protein
MRKINENFHIFHIQKRIVSAETICRNRVFYSMGSCGVVFGGDIVAAILQQAAKQPQQHIKGNKIQKQIRVINAIINGGPGQ